MVMNFFPGKSRPCLKSAKQCILLRWISTKFGRVAFSKICDINHVQVVVTDEKPSDVWHGNL